MSVYTLVGLESKQFWFVNNSLTKYYDWKTRTLVNNQMQNGTSVAFSLIMEMENTNKKCNLAIHRILLNASCFQSFRIVFCFSPHVFRIWGIIRNQLSHSTFSIRKRSSCYQEFIFYICCAPSMCQASMQHWGYNRVAGLKELTF